MGVAVDTANRRYKETDLIFAISRFRAATHQRATLNFMELFLAISTCEGSPVKAIGKVVDKDPIALNQEIKKLHGYNLVKYIPLLQYQNAPGYRGKAPNGIFLTEDGRQLLSEMLS